MLFQTPYQGVAERGKMRSLYPKSRVLTTRMADDGLEYLALIERPKMAAIMSISLSCCRSISSGNNRCASGAS